MSFILLVEQAAPDTPSTSQVILYPKSDGIMYSKDDAGTERAIALGVATQAEVDAGVVVKAITADLNRIALGTPIATTSGTSHDFTGIPAGVRRITVSLEGISTNGTSVPIVQLGDAGGIEATDYLGSAGEFASASQAAATYTTGVGLAGTWSATVVFHGVVEFTLINSTTNLWSARLVGGRSDAGSVIVGGSSKALSAVLTQVRLTTVNGTDAFDAGSVNITYER